MLFLCFFLFVFFFSVDITNVQRDTADRQDSQRQYDTPIYPDNYTPIFHKILFFSYLHFQPLPKKRAFHHFPENKKAKKERIWRQKSRCGVKKLATKLHLKKKSKEMKSIFWGLPCFLLRCAPKKAGSLCSVALCRLALLRRAVPSGHYCTALVQCQRLPCYSFFSKKRMPAVGLSLYRAVG